MSRQARKESATAARDLLKVDAGRARKAAGAPVRKATVVSGRMDAAAPAGKDAAATPTRCFNDGTFFYNESPGEFFNSPGSSSQQWNRQSLDPAMWGTNATPLGGFTNLIQPQMSQNFIFSGEPYQYPPLRPPHTTQDAHSEEGFSTPVSANANSRYVDVDNEEEAPRTEKRIFWTQEEDVRMMSAWLLNSTDSSCGADRKNEQYWSDVEVTYNETAPSHRARNAKQIKDRFHKVNKWTDLFHSAWVKARMVYSSGYNDQMWIEKAHAFYLEDNKKLKLGPFVLMEVWNTVKTEAKWITYNNGLKAARKKSATKGSVNDLEVDAEGPIDLDELDELPRPMGQKQAKKLKFAKSKEVEHIDLEELEKFDKIQDKQNASRLKVLEVQEKLSSEKIEQSRLAHLAAKEQKEAAQMQKEAKKLELESRMFETYNHLLTKDLSLMSDEDKLDHASTMKCLKKRLFSDN
ncbi:unnamed protein product [Urochloa humidicola]